MSQPLEQPQRGRRKGYYARQVEAEAARQGLTVEEYGVYKGDVGSAVKPINSAGGLLFLSILITLIVTVVAVLMVKVLTDGTEEPNWGQLVFAAAFGLWIVPTTWAYYVNERKAARLRRQNGKTIELPTRRNSVRD
ncbi:hypothetical protein [Arthrobacter sp. ISL-69]|uniref:hypothetical protein n=1 Tax=Arthrobacter sp. ISL-69 TaxID=2819113 RepID=UPI001BE68F06|nr:hypothetical protein [Arthrobacter sp. ISL-69]MBT2537018.1 hypothetical protein [Arthrobacter sp. ISL-69]